MIRILLEYMLPIILPTVLYIGWLVAEQKRTAAGAAPREIKDAPWIWLLALGVFFAVLIALATALMGPSSIDGIYVPPQLKDGVIVPGHVEPGQASPPGRGTPR
jgi:hypothetical protein